MKLHEDKRLFKQLVRTTADALHIAPIYVEKDYWVTYALLLIFNSPAGADAIFKGGTALLKCFGLIERFSEDIDIVVIRHTGESDNKLKTKIKAIGEVVKEVLPEIIVSELTRKTGMSRKTAHLYNRDFQGA